MNESNEYYDLLNWDDLFKEKQKETDKNINNNELNFSNINLSQDVNNFLGSELDYYEIINNKSKFSSTTQNSNEMKWFM